VGKKFAFSENGADRAIADEVKVDAAQRAEKKWCRVALGRGHGTGNADNAIICPFRLFAKTPGGRRVRPLTLNKPRKTYPSLRP